MTWGSRTAPIKVGDLVAYRADFLRNTGQQTGEMPFARGRVVSLKQLGEETTIAEIDWGNPEIPPKVNVRNLCRTGERGFSLS